LKVVCNSSVIIGLSVIGKLDLLWKLFDEIYVPSSVYHEVCIKGRGRVGSTELSNAIKQGKIKIISPKNKTLVESLVDPLGYGESETIVLAIELSADYACIDEKIARKKAFRLGVKVKGTIGILWLALRRNLVSKEEFLRCIGMLEKFGFRFRRKVIEEYLRKLKNRNP